ncbi:lasso peptide biosynthesis B2 protein [Priestia aryabhattai]|uniref:lasso peptide biosynthesis B2 protein n=1 Tax=Priestia TaxID=2800373 RepID=UPI001455D567|nr:lasso peptide biosynthesis B2 protein [Priestia aryabhattai]MBY0007031.1 lasso peptide biosynthesis B2 protein [Priestia aryabhattai]MBY0048535.1 lasso peptide biosynthesis B2 protein [Priestia aryabhattai]NLR43302.1 lasso peptide biosynthesis B2 protein [Priestia megaterium]
MALIKKLKDFLLFDWKTKNLLLESYLYLGWSRYLKSVPFSKVAPTLGNHMEETAFTLNSSNKEILASVSQAIHTMSRYTFWESQCLVKAIAAMKMLEKRQIDSTLYLGTAREENGELVAHAWLRSGPFYITGAEVMERFTVVSKFAKKL